MTEASDQIIFWAVVLARFLVPLTIPRYPLPGISIALVIDGVDQTIFQQFAKLPLEGYQGYDKALDIYYLTIAYISTLRNWSNRFAFQVGRFLFYYRLVGVALFELSHLRALLLILPNTFEYFFIFYEAFRLRWEPRRMTHQTLISVAAVIWIVIKLPQEYWIHIAQLDATDWIKTNLFDVQTATPWSEVFRKSSGIFLALGTLAISLLVAAWWFVPRRLPSADRKPAFSADAHQPSFSDAQAHRARSSEAAQIVDSALFEKVALVSLVSIIFAQIIPNMQASNGQISIGVAFIITINATLSHWMARRGTEWAFALRQFMVMGVVNFGLALSFALLTPSSDGSFDLGNALFFVLMLTLMVTLFDRYRQVYLMRFPWSA